jgi:nucleotide-binding universal stress UspA family protein
LYFTSIMAVTDLSNDGDYAVERAAQVALSHGATLKLMYASMSSESVCADPAARMAQNATAMSSRLGLTVHAVDASAATPEQVARHAEGADLLVIPYRREWTLKALLCGQPAIRLARMLHCPILVTRRASWKRFQRILVALDFEPPSRNLAMLARALEKDAQVELFHAVNTVGESRLRQFDVPAHVVKSYRQRCLQYAQQRMSALTESLGAKADGMRSTIGRGDPARQALNRQAYVGAELLVVGKRHSTALADFFIGSSARRVLGLAKCDVLVVPHGFRPSTHPAASPRMRAGSAVGNDALDFAKGRTP